MRVAFLGGTGPVGRAALPRLLAAGHDVAVAHTGAHEPPAADGAEHLHGVRGALLAVGGPVEAWRPDVVVDTFAGGATAAKAAELRGLAERADVAQLVAVSSIDVYRHCAHAGVGGFAPAPLATDPLPLTEDRSPPRTEPLPMAPHHDNVAMEAALGGAPKVTRAPDGVWACNVVDPYDWTFSGLAALAADEPGWTWEPRRVPADEGDHPWLSHHPVVADDTHLRGTLGVAEPDPEAATRAQIRWLAEHAEQVAAVPARGA